MRTRALVKEIKELSGLSTEKLSEELRSGRHIDVSAGVLRQYLTGKAPASLSRQRALALAAKQRNWAGEVCRDVEFWTSPELKAWCIRHPEPNLARVVDRVLLKTESGIKDLLELGFDVADVEYLVTMRIKELARARST